MTLDWPQLLGWIPNASQLDSLRDLYESLIVTNRDLNLTRITDIEDYWEKHVWDSLFGISPWLQLTDEDPDADDPNLVKSVIDIGTGGGFPGFPVAIACPQWQVTLLDSTHKKINCLKNIYKQLGLHNVTAVCDRAEQLGAHPQFQTTFDVALIRAVGGASVCAEYCLPFLKLQGQAVLYRGQWSLEEEKSLNHALSKLGGEVIQVRAGVTPLSGNQRHCIDIQKTTPTPPEYPRRVGLAKRKPL